MEIDDKNNRTTLNSTIIDNNYVFVMRLLVLQEQQIYQHTHKDNKQGDKD